MYSFLFGIVAFSSCNTAHLLGLGVDLQGFVLTVFSDTRDVAPHAVQASPVLARPTW